MIRIVVTMEGGLITGVMSDFEEVEVLLVDYDIDGMPDTELFTNPDGDTARMHIETQKLLPDRVEAFFQCLRRKGPA